MAHIPVLLNKAIDYLNIHPGGLYIDGTLGGGGHSEAIVSQLDSTGHLYAFDKDQDAISRSKERLEPFGEKVTIIHDTFERMTKRLASVGVHSVDGILLDLGVSSFHFDEASRGFSYRHDAPLDMRMDLMSPFSAYDLINTYTVNDLTRVFRMYGEEPFSRPIAKHIAQARDNAPIETTQQLVDIIKDALPNKILRKKGHPAKRVFQAIRIEVNDELGALESALESGLELLKPAGRLVIITFHSLEDRMVKHRFKDAASVDHPKALPTMPTTTPDFKVITKNVVRPSEEEITDNPRAASAKLRVIERVAKK